MCILILFFLHVAFIKYLIYHWSMALFVHYTLYIASPFLGQIYTQSSHAWELMFQKYGKISHDDVIKWTHFPRYWPFVRGIHRSPVNSPHKGQWRGGLMFSLICDWMINWVTNRDGDLRRNQAHYDAIVMDKLYIKAYGSSLWREGLVTVSIFNNGHTLSIKMASL